jgi:hypothetical protein
MMSSPHEAKRYPRAEKSAWCSFVRPWPLDTPELGKPGVKLPPFVATRESEQYVTTLWNQGEWSAAGGYVGLGSPDWSEPSRGMMMEAVRVARERMGPNVGAGESFLIDPQTGSATRMHHRDALKALLSGIYAFPTVVASGGDECQDGLILDAALISVAGVSTELINTLGRHPYLLHQLHWRKFEEIIAELLARSGFDVDLTSGSKDHGVDIYAIRRAAFGRALYVVECKKYAPHRGIGPGLVRQLYGVVEREKATQGLLATTSFFTKGAMHEQRDLQFRLCLGDFAAIRDWLRTMSHT